MYRIDLLRGSQKSLEKIQPQERTKIYTTILQLENNPKPEGVNKLRDTNFWRVREGDYRIIYSIDDKNKIITVTKIGHRREIYRGF